MTEYLDSFIGLTIEEVRPLAKILGYNYIYITREDGIYYFGTSDYREDRLRIYLKDKKIFSVNIG